MKKYIIPGLVLLTGLALAACDKIDPPYTEGNSTVDTTECPVPAFPVKQDHHKVVMIEEFTGHTCVYCPQGATVLHNMEPLFGDSLIVIAVHAGSLAEPDPDYLLDLTTSTGDELNAYFGITGNPAAVFNRKNIGGSIFSNATANWQSLFLQVVDTVPLIDMQMINEYTESLKRVCIHVQTEYLVDLNRPLKIAVYVTEDSIIGNQKTLPPTNIIHNYVFMNVLRGAVNGTWGEDLSTSAVTAGTKTITNYKLIIDNAWNHDRCYIVAFVYDAGTNEVLGAVRGKVEP